MPRPLLALLFLMLPSAPALALFEEPKKPAASLTPELRAQIVEKLGKELQDRYVFPELAKQMQKRVTEKLRAGGYDACADRDAFGQQLTDDLRAIAKDKHLRVGYRGDGPRPLMMTPNREEMQAEQLARNSGFVKLERLPGNLGYLDLRLFMDPDVGGDTVAAAFAFLANTDALIIDLRKNGGGSPAMIRLISSYLFDEKPVHLNSIWFREGDRTEEFWTLKEVKGPRYGPKDVYVLTSAFTFSGAEEFSYNLKNLKRATIIGETTGGGAHPVRGVDLPGGFFVGIPIARAINPISKTNWEGVGVQPDVPCHADEALAKAQELAIEKLKAAKDPKVAERVKRDLEGHSRMEKRIEELRVKNLKDQGK